MRRYKTRYKSNYKRKRPRRRSYKRNSGMKKATKDMLKGAGVATAILVFSQDTYATISQWLGKMGAK
jgi:hypothetical protein